MLARKCFLACAMLGIASLAFGSGVDGITIVHHEPLERLTLHRDGIVGNQKTAAPAPVTVSFDALGRSFDLELQPNAGLLMAMAGSELSNSIVPYRGRIAGSPGSWARIVIVDGMPAGGAHLHSLPFGRRNVGWTVSGDVWPETENRSISTSRSARNRCPQTSCSNAPGKTSVGPSPQHAPSRSPRQAGR